MVADLRYFNSLEHEVDTLKSQLETQKTQFLNKIDLLSRKYYYVDHMNAILGVYTDLDEVTNLQYDYMETWEKCERLEKELSKSRTMSKILHNLPQNMIANFQEHKCAAPGMRNSPIQCVSRPHLKSNQLEDRVMSNNSQGKKQEVENHRRNFKFSNNKTSVTTCNDSLNAKPRMLTPLSLSFDFVFLSEIFKSLSFCLDRLCHLAILCLDQHAHTLHHLESLLTISLDRLDIFEGRSCISEFVRNSSRACVMNSDSSWNEASPSPPYIQRISLTGFPAQSVRSSNADALDSPYLLVLNTGTSQSRQHGKSESVSYYLSESRQFIYWNKFDSHRIAPSFLSS
ncbi:hypothetical protein Tco_0685434 [Tanacetum coccineum]